MKPMSELRERMRRFIQFVTRVDIGNRILVFLSMVFSLILPSIILYHTENYSDIGNVLPPLMVLGIVLGTGLFTLYKPIKTTLFYFLESGATLLVYSPYFQRTDLPGIERRFNPAPFFWTDFAYCAFGFLVNLAFALRFFYVYRKGKGAFDEHGNANTFHDFLNGMDINPDVETSIEKISQEGGDFVMSWMKRIKLSRWARTVTLVIFWIVALYYLIRLGGKGTLSTSPMTIPFVLGLVFLTLALFSSVYFPGDFKYLYYYNGIFFALCCLFCVNKEQLSPLFLILLLAVMILAMLTTLITEGRTWTGAKPDTK